MVGEILRKRREETGRDLRDIAKTLKIRHDYLKAIEDETFEKLPEEVYVKGYIREYAELLNINPETAISSYIQQISPPKIEAGELPEKEAAPVKKIKIRYVLVPAVFLMIAVTSVLFLQSREKPGISRPLGETRKSAPATVAGTNKENPPLTVGSKTEITPSPISGQGKEIPPNTVEPKKENISKTENFRHTLQIFAAETTWLAVNIDGAGSRELLMKPGETVKLRAKDGFSLKIGNAGGAKVVFDGKEIGKLGEKNQVIKLDLPEAGT